MTDLPDFRQPPDDYVQGFAETVFGASVLQAVEQQAGGYYRATFATGYFTLQPGHTEPSKSQWNTLKKRMKRINPGVFVFKAHGTEGDTCYVDFGFFAD